MPTIAGVQLSGRVARGVPFYSIQVFNGRWREAGRLTGNYDDAKRLAAHFSKTPQFSAVRIRMKTRTLAWFERGKQLKERLRTVAIWPDGSREWWA